MTRILRISADFRVFPVDFLLFLFCSSFFQKLDPRVSAQSASSAFYDLAFSDTLLEDGEKAMDLGRQTRYNTHSYGEGQLHNDGGLYERYYLNCG